MPSIAEELSKSVNALTGLAMVTREQPHASYIQQLALSTDEVRRIESDNEMLAWFLVKE